MDSKLNKIVDDTRFDIFKRIEELLPVDGNVLTDVIRYSLLNKGKRLRPLLIMETFKLFNNNVNKNILNIAVAIEMLHTFSLIHDDLPAMDNDDYRRGELTCHKKFNEYDAILAGDSLVFLAYEIILKETDIEQDKKFKILLKISEALGYKGMCLGQSLDLDFEKNSKQKRSEDADKINILKTGCLFKACIEIGCILGEASDIDTKNMIDFSMGFGKAFQLADDLDDNEIIEEDINCIKEKIKLLVKGCIKSLDMINTDNIDSLKNLKLIAEFCKK